MDTLAQSVTRILGAAPTRIRALSGGCIGAVYRVDLPDRPPVVAKVGEGSRKTLDTEAAMLRYLAQHSRLPVPEVLHSEPALLLLAYVEGHSFFDDDAQRHAAELLADLHSIRPAHGKFGLEQDTLIGSLDQPNPLTDSWLEFFREHRLHSMAREANRAGQLPGELLRRIDLLSDQLDRWLEEPEHPSLIHGDCWTTNILSLNGRITAFIDPAIYYAHPEIELAFTTLFNTFDAAFFERYHELRPIEPGFFEARRDLYNLYPLLVHVRLFGGGYVDAVDRIARRFGF